MSAKSFPERFISNIESYGELKNLIETCRSVTVPKNRDELISLTMNGTDTREITYELPDGKTFKEAYLVRAKNGIVINFPEPYMRRRDPEGMVIADSMPTDKVRFKERFSSDFGPLRGETFEWLSTQDLIFILFYAGGEEAEIPSLLVCPLNAAFFASATADLQGMVSATELPENFTPEGVIYVAPPFRHTYFQGRQVVAHYRSPNRHEIFSYHLHPEAGAKKGAFGLLLEKGERQGWLTLHGSTVRVITPYENMMTIMHEGASGSGKSEMIEQLRCDIDGKVIVGENSITGEEVILHLADRCTLQPVTDDMALASHSLQKKGKHLFIQDAEQGWLLRINHIDKYGRDPFYEKITIHPPEPLIFLNIRAHPNATALIWEHTMDSPDTPCPNPAVIMPRRFVEGVIDGPVEVDLRCFGVQTPPCTAEKPSYGIIGLFHALPPALAWLWRLVAPREQTGPSGTDEDRITSEGVGSYWPFATGRMVDQANLLLHQMLDTPATRYKLIPNRYIGAYEVGFMPQWVAREYLSRRGSARFREEQLIDSRCSLLGFSPHSIKIDGTFLPKNLLRVELQPEVGTAAYDEGSRQLYSFFERELKKFMSPDLHVTGRLIIECFHDRGSAGDFESLMPHEFG